MTGENDTHKIHGRALNGYKIRSWGDLVAVATILAMLLSTVAWGLKLESELNELRNSTDSRLRAVESRIAVGVLPRAEERLNSQTVTLQRHERRIDRLEQRVDEHNQRHD